jgi:hypothetical protein
MPSYHAATWQAQQVAFSHSTIGSPALFTLQAALDNNYVTGFPGLASKSLRQHPSQSKATSKGHIDQIRQGTKSTKLKPTVQPSPDHEFDFPKPLPKGERTHS